jgi:hypothetical protein
MFIKENTGITDQDKIDIGVRPINPDREPIDCPTTPPLINVLGNAARDKIEADLIGNFTSFTGGTMGTASYVLAGTRESEARAFGSACHGAGRAMSRKQATKRWHGRDIVTHLAARGIIVRSPSLRGIAEEAPGAYKDVTKVVEAADRAGLARIVARLEPMVCIKG